ncbi:MAG TPA: S53 family peptidase [Acidimicrobiales bacterium]|jgi:subtilase family serine protease|nr:S53 family peptidase [Acidimicrobiales bacterium]
MNRGSMRRTAALGVVTLAVVGILGASQPAGSASSGSGSVLAPLVKLVGSVPLLPSGASVLGPTDPNAQVSVDVSLKPRDQAALDTFVRDVSTPGSPEFRHYLSPGAFGPRFGPTDATLTAVRSWLSTTGLQVGATNPGGLLIPVSGNASQIEQAFGVSLVAARLPSGRVARNNTTTPKVPANLVGVLQGVIGLSTVVQPHAQIKTARPSATAATGGGTLAGGTSGPTATPKVSANAVTAHAVPTACAAASALHPVGYTADQVANTYGISTLYGQGRTGSGVKVGIYELEPYTPSDIAAYQSCFGTNVSVQNVKVDGGASGSQGGEAALDIEDVASMAPGASIVVYSGPQGGNGPIDIYARMVGDDATQVITTSWGICEPQMDPGQQAAESSLFAQASAQGQTVVAASGDAGSSDCYNPSVILGGDNSLQVDDPADQPYVTGAGGTSIQSAGSPPTETVWNSGPGTGAAGGGVSTDFAQPSWQSGAGVDAPSATSVCNLNGRSTCREVPDVSALADPAHGFINFWGGSWGVAGGTSVASPLWGALLAVIDQGQPATVGFANPALYSCGPSGFNDVTAGNNDLFPVLTTDYSATPNYDVASGWGSPAAPTLAANLSAGSSCTKGLPGYWLVASDGGIFSFGHAGFYGSTGALNLNRPIVGMAATPDGGGYWLVASDGGIFSFGDAGFHGSTGALRLNRPIVGMATTPDGGGYWLVASDGGIFSFGDAGFHGSTGALTLNRPIVGMATTPDGGGYWLVASDGGIFSFGDAGFHGSTGALRLNQPIVGMAAVPGGGGYWLVASDGGIFAFGNAGFHGSTGGTPLNRPIVGISATADGAGYWLVGSDGGVFTFGDARFFGSTGALVLNRPIVGMAST